MNTRIDYAQIAAKLDYTALDKKLSQLAEREPPKKRRTAEDLLEPLREKLLALYRKGWSSGQLAAELKTAGVPVSPARLRECLSRWIGNGNKAGRQRVRRLNKRATASSKPTVTASQPARVKSGHDDGQPGLKLTER
ncbi:MAG: hypothetical protein DME24_18660 [Verrucomicrobia bacterium]|nr:MAG: hypothetical protein DME24_18660 [Verrucomicrobiota bacterium]